MPHEVRMIVSPRASVRILDGVHARRLLDATGHLGGSFAALAFGRVVRVHVAGILILHSQSVATSLMDCRPHTMTDLSRRLGREILLQFDGWAPFRQSSSIHGHSELLFRGAGRHSVVGLVGASFRAGAGVFHNFQFIGVLGFWGFGVLGF